MVTITESTSQEISDERQFKVPNEVAKIQFLDELRKIIKIHDGAMTLLGDNPTEENVKNFLWTIIQQQETIHDCYFSEGGLQGEIEAALRAKNEERKVAEIIRVDREYNDGTRPDMIIKMFEKVIMFEFKRIRPNAIPYIDGKFQKNLIEPNNWFPSDYTKLFNYLNAQSEKFLLKLRIADRWQPLYQNCTTVEELLKKAKLQLKGYADKELQLNPESEIYRFVVIQVGMPIIVKKC